MNEVDVSEMSHHDAVMTLKNAGKEVTLVVLREITDEDAIETALQVSQFIYYDNVTHICVVQFYICLC